MGQQFERMGCLLSSFNCLRIFGFLVLCLTGCQSSSPLPEALSSHRGIVNGNRITKKEAPAYGAIFLILAHSKEGLGICTGTHIGQASILTAHHCVARIVDETNEKPVLQLLSATDYIPTEEISKDDYEISSPEKESERQIGEVDGKKIYLREPDVSLIQFKGDFADYLNKFPKASLPETTLKAADPALLGAGFGLDSFEPPEISGRLNAGKMKLEIVDEFYYILFYHDGEEFVSALPGDSGGPLFKFDKQKNLELYGVTSILAPTGYDDLGTITSAINLYVRLDRKPIREWLKKVMPN